MFISGMSVIKPKPAVGAVALRMPVFPTLSEQLAKRIADEILNEHFWPGQRLKEVDLALAFGVSRASIREALRQLEVQGLVQIEPRRGARVTQLSADEVDDLYEIRASLLAVASRRVALTRDAAFLAKARTLLARIAEHAPESMHARYFDAVYAMSQLIAESAKSERLATLISSFSRQVARYTRLSLSTLERRKKSAQGWKRLIVAIDAGDPKKAEEEMRRLVTGSQETIREMLRAERTNGRHLAQRRAEPLR
jgi:DNA-binding GntR family transcriptional regulator